MNHHSLKKIQDMPLTLIHDTLIFIISGVLWCNAPVGVSHTDYILMLLLSPANIRCCGCYEGTSVATEEVPKRDRQ